MCYKASNTLCCTINMYHEYDANVKRPKSYIRFTFSPSRAISKLRSGAEVIIMIVPVPLYSPYRVKFSRIWNVAKEVVSFLAVGATSHCYTNLTRTIGQLASGRGTSETSKSFDCRGDLGRTRLSALSSVLHTKAVLLTSDIKYLQKLIKML